jgi:aminomethyltransferase
MSDLITVLARTPLYPLHVELGARMVPFAGYEMPMQYPTGIIKEHIHCRSRASLFDVSHMGQIRLTGGAARTALESLVPADIAGLASGRQRYALFINEAGGILDDLMVANLGDRLLLVVNAAKREDDLALLERGLGGRCDVALDRERALLALQGPEAARLLGRLAPRTAGLSFMDVTHASIDEVPCIVSRSGYTGEDGFEISVPADEAMRLARRLLDEEDVLPAGLGARDSLRLEAGLPLYGHDVDETTNPVEAGLAWAIGKARRPGGARAGGFPGAEAIFAQLAAGPARRRVGFVPEGKTPVREGQTLFHEENGAHGRITSGGYSATLAKPIAMGYVATRYSAPGATLHAEVRGRRVACHVAELPFVPHRYFRGRA